MKKIILLLAMGVALTTQTLFAQVPSYVPTDGLVGYWPFSGNANDVSLNANNGTNNGATLTADRFGNANSAYTFDGLNDFIDILHSSSLSFTSYQQTISFWIKVPSIPQPSVLEAVMSKYSNVGNATQGFIIHFSGSSSLFYSIKNGSGFNWGDCPLDSTNFYPPNSYYHIVYTNDNNSLKCYVNGIEIISTAIPTGTFIGTNTSSLVFGKESNMGGGVDFFQGELDDIGIWNRALTQQEITNLYNANQCITNITVTDTLIINVGQLSYNNPVTYANNITMAPNPASSQININFNNITNLNGGTLKIINSLGQEVATTPITTSGTNSTVQLATWGGTGMYFVQIINPQGQIVDIKKIILQ